MVDLRYLFMHQFDPVGPYRSDDNAVLTLAQTLASGLFQIQSAYAVPTDLTGMSDDLVQQRLANPFPHGPIERTGGVVEQPGGVYRFHGPEF